MSNVHTTSVVRLRDVGDDVLASWRAIVDGAKLNASLEPDWVRVTAASRGVADDTFVFVARRGREIVAVAPFRFETSRVLGVPIKKLNLITNYVAYHNSLPSTLEPAVALSLLLEFAATNGADVVELAAIDDETRLARAVLECEAQVSSVRRFPGEASPFIPLDTSWDELLASKPKKFRYKVRKRAEALSESPDLALRWYRNEQDCAELLQAMESIERSSWKQEAGVAIFSRDHEKRYHELLLPLLAQRGALVANVLSQAGKPIAYTLGCHAGGWFGLLKTSFDAAYSELSPGAIVADQAIAVAIELKAREFDFLGDQDQYKLAWSKLVRAHSSYYLYLRRSLRGRLLGWGKVLGERILSQRSRRA